MPIKRANYLIQNRENLLRHYTACSFFHAIVARVFICSMVMVEWLVVEHSGFIDQTNSDMYNINEIKCIYKYIFTKNCMYSTLVIWFLVIKKYW